MTRTALCLMSLLALSACSSPAGLALAGASMATLIHTDKTVVDHAVSWATDKNCSVLHSAKNRDYCQPYEPVERAQVAYLSASLYCYRTLGGVDCYDRPDYTASSQTRIIVGDTLIPPLESAPLAALPEGGLR